MATSRMILKIPANRIPERRYVARWVCCEQLGLTLDVIPESRSDWCLTAPDTRKRLLLPDSFFSVADGNWLRCDSLPSEPLPTFKAGRCFREANLIRPELPVIAGKRDPEGAWVASVSSDTAYLGVDVFGAAFFMLSRYEELTRSERDDHSRFPAFASLANEAQFLDRPIVDEYVELLRAMFDRMWPSHERPRKSYSVLVTHDIDHASGAMGLGPARLLRRLAGDLVRRRRPAIAARRLGSALLPGDRADSLDPHFTFDRLMELSENRGLRSAFYFMAAERSDFDSGYDLLAPRMLKLLGRINERGHEIGFHPSYRTLREPDRLESELRTLKRAMDASGARQSEVGGRQHYLRWDPEATWRHWERAGLTYDSTVGYARQPGFRSGTAHSYSAWSFADGRQLSLRERPLIAMDGTLFSERYLGLDVDDALVLIRRLVDACRTVNGEFVFLWHNHYHLEVGAFRVYERILDILAN